MVLSFPATATPATPAMHPRGNTVNDRNTARGNAGSGGGLPRKPRVVQIRTPSVASSPGRGTPSPDSLARICLYWEKRLNSPEYVIPTSSSEESE